MTNRFIRFAALGLIPTAAYYVLVFCSVELDVLNPSLAMPLAFVSAVVISYQLNRRFTWNVTEPRGKHFQLYFIISVLGAITNYLLFLIIVQLFQASYTFAVIAVTVVIPVQNFVLNDNFNFK